MAIASIIMSKFTSGRGNQYLAKVLETKYEFETAVTAGVNFLLPFSLPRPHNKRLLRRQIQKVL